MDAKTEKTFVVRMNPEEAGVILGFIVAKDFIDEF